jgi:hypothetical protein
MAVVELQDDEVEADGADEVEDYNGEMEEDDGDTEEEDGSDTEEDDDTEESHSRSPLQPLGLEAAGLPIPCPWSCEQTFETYLKAIGHAYNKRKIHLCTAARLIQDTDRPVSCPWTSCTKMIP